MTKWQRKYNHAHNQQKWWDKNTQKIYNLMMQPSTPKMKIKLLTMDPLAETSATQDGIARLKMICDILVGSFNFWFQFLGSPSKAKFQFRF
jgi:hypothetical protein